MSYKQAALDWLDELAPRSWFRAADVPAPASTVYPLLSRLVRDPDDIRFERVGPDIYFKGDPSVALRCWGGSNVVTALIYAGAGAGLGIATAIHQLGWSTQHPARLHVATTRRLRPWYSSLSYIRNPNRRRNELNWTEVTLLEGLHDLAFVERDWQLCMRRLREGQTLEQLPWSHVQPPTVRTDQMLWAADQERLISRYGCRSLSELKLLIEEIGEAAHSERRDAAEREDLMRLAAPQSTRI